MTQEPSDESEAYLKFIDYIKTLPPPWVFSHFLKNGDAGRKILSSSAIADRIREFSRQESLREQFLSLDGEQRVQCAFVYLFGATGLEAPAGLKDLSDPLVGTFLVYAARNKGGAVRYFGFREFEAALGPVAAKTIIEAASHTGKISPLTPRQGPFINDAAVVSVLAEQGELDKKKNGALSRSAVDRIAKLTHGTGPAEGADTFALLLASYGVKAGFLRETEKAFLPVADGFAAWAARPADDRTSELTRFAVEFSGGWSMRIIEELLLGATDNGEQRWLSTEVLSSKERTLAVRTLHILRWAGIVDCAMNGSETLFGPPRGTLRSGVHGAPAVKRDTELLLPPDFSAVLPAESSCEELSRFGKIGTLQSLDRVYKGIISRETIGDSLSNGVDGETIMQWLDEWRAPANVRETVREWIREFHRVFLSEGLLLVTSDAKVSHEIAGFEPLRGLIESVPAHALFKIKRGAEQEVREILARMGLDCRMPDPARTAAPEPAFSVPHQSAVVWEPIVKSADDEAKKTIPLHGKKYGTGLKALDLNETMHIIDYAILTGHAVEIEYAGSASVKKGTYTATPQHVARGAEPLLDAVLKTGRKVQFIVGKIGKIGVGTV
jgi:hypothetical protein